MITLHHITIQRYLSDLFFVLFVFYALLLFYVITLVLFIDFNRATYRNVIEFQSFSLKCPPETITTVGKKHHRFQWSTRFSRKHSCALSPGANCN